MNNLDNGPAVQTRNLHKTYEDGTGELQALRGVDLVVPYGEFVCVLGPSGSGKSSLLHLIGGLDTPTEGSVSVSGTRIDSLTPDAAAVFRRRTVGVVHQFFNLLPSLTVEENIATPLLLDGKRLPQLEQEIEELLDFFQITAHRYRYPDQLSGGEMQRVALARAVLIQPRVILADEPTGNLDAKTSEDVLSFFRRTVDERRIALILVTHDLRATSHADRIIEMEDGKVKSDIRPLADRPG